MMFLTDVSSFMDFFINLLITGVTSCFNILDNITFYGITLLDFFLALLIIPVGLSIFLAVSRIGGKTTGYLSNDDGRGGHGKW